MYTDRGTIHWSLFTTSILVLILYPLFMYTNSSNIYLYQDPSTVPPLELDTLLDPLYIPLYIHVTIHYY
jgi:hypothetical protein